MAVDRTDRKVVKADPETKKRPPHKGGPSLERKRPRRAARATQARCHPAMRSRLVEPIPFLNAGRSSDLECGLGLLQKTRDHSCMGKRVLAWHQAAETHEGSKLSYCGVVVV
jgi:hypothetical protein